jgi:MFS family permease
MPSDSPNPSYRDALASAEFRWLFTAFTVSIFGSVVSAVALMVLIYQRTSSPFLASLTFALAFTPYLVSGALLSATVDRIPIRRLLVGCDLMCAAVVAAMAIPGVPVAVLLAQLTLVGLLGSVSSGARSAVLPSLVTNAAYVPARSLFRISAQSAQIAGNAIGGALLVFLSPRGTLLIDAASFFVSALLVRRGLGSRPAVTAPNPQETLVRDSLRGLREVMTCAPLARLLLLGWLLPTFAVAPEALAAPYVADLGGTSAMVGWWLVAIPLGFVVGDLVGVWKISPARQQRLVTPLALLVCVPFLAFLFQPSFAVAFPLLVLSGVGAAYSLGLDALQRAAAPPALFARAMAINTSGLIALQGLGFAAAGALTEVVPAHVTIVCAGVAGLVVVALLRPRAVIDRGPTVQPSIDAA